MKTEQRLLSNVLLNEKGCWVWQGCKRNSDGYGQICVGGKLKMVHRTAFEVFKGPIPKNMYVLHKCDNPPCCNPDHLFIGTLSDNVQDCLSKHRHVALRGESNRLAKLNDQKVREIRVRYAGGEPIASLFRAFNVSRRAIRFVVQNKTWRHV